MTLADFLDGLFSTGSVTVPLCRKAADLKIEAQDETDCAELLATLELSWRLEMPGRAPKFAPSAAVYGLRVIYTAAVAMVSRELDQAELGNIWTRRASSSLGEEAELHYSADLTLRFLPSVMKLTQRLAPEDPLNGELAKFALAWPLSSVGVNLGEGAVALLDLRPILGHPCLRQLYVDRVIESRDLSRLGDVQVAEEVRQVLGLRTEIWPQAAARLVVSQGD